jgi:Skp family chaperone for outer membrane proteins
MTLHRTLRNLMILSAAALTLASSVTARPAQAAPTGMPLFGSVDLAKIQAQSSKKAKYDAELHALADRLNTAFTQQAASIMLTKAEQTELGGLLSKANPNDIDRGRTAVLQAQAAKAAQELADLQQSKAPTPADTAKLASLTSQYETGKAALAEISDSYQAQLKSLNDKDSTEFTQSLREAIAAVAQQRGLAVVFTSDVAVYTANDITDDVVKRVNK